MAKEIAEWIFRILVLVVVAEIARGSLDHRHIDHRRPDLRDEVSEIR